MNRMNTTMDAVDRASIEIANVLRAIRMLALNGNVEAARAGSAGAAFAVVVGHMYSLVDQVHSAVENITSSSQEGHAVLAHLRQTEEELRARVQTGASVRGHKSASAALHASLSR